MVQGVTPNNSIIPSGAAQAQAPRRGGARHAAPADAPGPSVKTMIALTAMFALTKVSAQVHGANPMPAVQHWPGPDGAPQLGNAGAGLVYGGKRLPDDTPSFYKENTHPNIGADKIDLSGLFHAGYLQYENMREVGKDLMIHRGVTDIHNQLLENTLAAIRKAYDSGIMSVEADIQTTRDGVPVNFHDRTLGRMTDDPQNRLVSSVTLDELKQADLVVRDPRTGDFVVTRDKQKIPSAQELMQAVVDHMPGMSLVLDCKDRNGEAIFELLREHPEFRSFTAIKPYSNYYKGGFDQFLGNLYEKHDIDPQSPQHQGQRDAMLALLKDLKVVPIFSQGMLRDKEFHALFADTVKDHYSTAELAGMALKWLQTWGSAMDVKIIEAHSAGPDTPEGAAMALLNDWLADEQHGLAKAAMSAAYRFSDFSTEKQDHGRDFYTWGDSGERFLKTDDLAAAVRDTAGALRDGDSILTDQVAEEAYAVAKGVTLPRGNTGVELDVKPGTVIDLSLDKTFADLRKKEYDDALKPLDLAQLKRVRAGRSQDAGSGETTARSDGHQWMKAVTGVALTAAGIEAARRLGAPIKYAHMGRSLTRAAQLAVHALAEGVHTAGRRMASASDDERRAYEMV
jgi:glycerophosphoryl diester phosphodiesterase